MNSAQRKKLRADGIRTVRELAEATLANPNASLLRLQDQARMQSGVGAADGEVRFLKDGEEHSIRFGVIPENTLAELPPPSDGDIFFDFEGDPLWQEAATGVWGLEYLFGVIEAPTGPGVPGVFKPFWAHDREAEKQAFLDFLEYVQKRRQDHPDMHVYHYAAYEKTALRKLSVMHVAGEDIVDGWLRDGLLVDLYQTVRNSIRISENSYSIKKLEPLYMGTNLRSGDVKDAGASVVAYAHYCDARDDGRAEEAATILAGISDYNEYDCLSTLELRNWLLGLARARGIRPGGVGTSATTTTAGASADSGSDAGADAGADSADVDPLEVALAELAGPGVGLSEDDRKAVSMLAAAVSYHRRERKAFWWAHFDRCENGPDTHHQQDRNVFLVEEAEVLDDWWKDGAKLPERTGETDRHGQPGL